MLQIVNLPRYMDCPLKANLRGTFNVLGPPDRRNDTIDARGKTSQWVYETESESLYLYFNRNGVLTSIQNRR